MLAKLEGLFEPDEVQTLMHRLDPSDAGSSTVVKVCHRPTGIEVLCGDQSSQIRNKCMALIELLDRLRRHEGS